MLPNVDDATRISRLLRAELGKNERARYWLVVTWRTSNTTLERALSLDQALLGGAQARRACALNSSWDRTSGPLDEPPATMESPRGRATVVERRQKLAAASLLRPG